MEDNKKSTINKIMLIDWTMAALVVVALVICYFFWGCDMDLWATVLCLVLVTAGTVLLQIQNKKLKEKL